MAKVSDSPDPKPGRAENRSRVASTAYVVAPERANASDSNAGNIHVQQWPGVLVLHSWWGLTPVTRSLCDKLADAGFVAMAPDLLNGQTPTTVADAELLLRDRDMNESAALVLSSVGTLRNFSLTTDGPIGVVGMSMGASWALWLATRAPDDVAAVSVFYGTQEIDFAGMTAAVQGHFAESDSFVDSDARVEMQAHLHLVGLQPEFHDYPGTEHWFFEPDQAAYDPQAAALAFDRVVGFLRANLGHEPDR